MSEDIYLGDVELANGDAACPMENFGEAPRIGVGLAVASLEAFFLGPHYSLEARGNEEVLGCASSSFLLLEMKPSITWLTG